MSEYHDWSQVEARELSGVKESFESLPAECKNCQKPVGQNCQLCRLEMENKALKDRITQLEKEAAENVQYICGFRPNCGV